LHRLDREDRDVPGATFVRHDLRVPVRRVGVRRRTAEHLRGDHRVRVRPCLVVLDAPLLAGEVPHRLDQGAADHLVVRRFHVELAVITAEPAQVGVELLRILQRLDRGDDRAEQPGPLGVHVHGEKIAQVRVRQEDTSVEVAGDLVLMILDQAPALLEQACEVSHVFRLVTAVG
jgi:hypothetical protein